MLIEKIHKPLLDFFHKLYNEILGYAADMTDTEVGFSSFYEYIYSFRNDIKSSYPNITDPEVVEAMENLKYLKNKLGEFGIKLNNNDINNCLDSANCLFIKTYNSPKHYDNYTLSNIPGKIEGISGSCIGGYSLGMNIYISEEKKGKIATIMEYITTIENEKKVTLNHGLQSVIETLFNDESLCQNYSQCQNFKSIQPILRPIQATEDYMEYSHKYRNHLLKYLYEGIDLTECHQNIKFLTTIFYEENNTLMNRIYIIVISISDIIIVFSYCLAFTKKHKFKFKLLNKFYWFLYMLGEVLIMSYGFTGMGKLTDLKCQVRSFVFSLGFTLSNTVIFIRMVINFPESERKFSRFCANNFGKVLLFSCGIDIILNAIGFIDPYRVERATDGNITYHICKLDGVVGIICFGLIVLYKIIILFGMAVLTFVEWNMKEFMRDVRNVTATLFISVIIYFLFSLMQNIGGYKERFLLPAVITYIYGFSCFSVYFIARFFTNYNNEDSDEATIKKALALQKPTKRDSSDPKSLDKSSRSSSQTRCFSNSNIGMQRKVSLMDHLMNLHNHGEEIKRS